MWVFQETPWVISPRGTSLAQNRLPAEPYARVHHGASPPGPWETPVWTGRSKQVGPKLWLGAGSQRQHRRGTLPYTAPSKGPEPGAHSVPFLVFSLCPRPCREAFQGLG